METFELYRINSNSYVFGGISTYKSVNIDEELVELMSNSDVFYFEGDYNYMKNFDFDRRCTLSQNCSLEEKMLLRFDCDFNNRKLKEGGFFEISAGAIYDSDFLEKLEKTLYFKRNLKGIDIKKIPFFEILEYQILPNKITSIVNYLAHRFSKKGKFLKNIYEDNFYMEKMKKNAINYFSFIFLCSSFTGGKKINSMLTVSFKEFEDNEDSILLLISTCTREISTFFEFDSLRKGINGTFVINLCIIKKVIENLMTSNKNLVIEKYNHELKKFEYI